MNAGRAGYFPFRVSTGALGLERCPLSEFFHFSPSRFSRHHHRRLTNRQVGKSWRLVGLSAEGRSAESQSKLRAKRQPTTRRSSDGFSLLMLQRNTERVQRPVIRCHVNLTIATRWTGARCEGGDG